MSMPLVAVIVAATIGIAATVLVFGSRVELPEAASAVTASAGSAEDWTRRAVRSVGATRHP